MDIYKTIGSQTPTNGLLTGISQNQIHQQFARMKASTSVLLTVALVSVSHACGSEEGGRTRLHATAKQYQSNERVHDILSKAASRQKKLVLNRNIKSAIAQLLEEAHAQGGITTGLLNYVIDDKKNHPIPECEERNEQLEQQIGPVKLNGIEYAILYYIYYLHRFDDLIYVKEEDIDFIIQGYIDYVNTKEDHGRQHYSHPKDPNFLQELKEKLREIQPNLGEAISKRRRSDTDEEKYDYVLTKPNERHYVLSYLLSCKPPPDTRYCRYSTRKIINDDILHKVAGGRFRINECNVPASKQPGFSFRYTELTGLEYITLLSLYQNRDEPGWDVSSLFQRYQRYVHVNYDPSYTLPPHTVMDIRNKIAKVHFPFPMPAHSFTDRGTLVVERSSREDKIIRTYLFCRNPPYDYMYSQ